MKKSAVLCGAVLLLAITFVFAHSHDGYCDHDSELERTRNLEAHQGKQFNRRAVDVSSVGRRENQVTWGAIRAEFNTDYILNDIESRTCYTSTGTYTTVCGTSSCTANCDANKQVTSALVQTVVTQLLPELRSILAQMAQVRTVTKLTLSGTKCNNGQGGVPLPNAVITNGLTNDILIMFTARPSINSQAIATTSVCFTETAYGRPVVAQINMDPNLFFRGQTYVQQKGTLLHELTHALGFSSDRFNSFVDPNTGLKLTTATTQAVTATYTDSSGTTNSQSVTYLTTPKLVAAMKSHFGCNSLPTSATPGVALEEFGSSGTAGSHFEKSVYFNELMAGSAAGQTGVSFAVSAFTLAFLDDSGWYKSNSSLVVSGASPLLWGKNTGCSMPTQRCENWSLGSLSNSYFCSSNIYTSSQQSVCTFNLRAKGSCSIQTYTSNLPGYYEHIRGSRTLGGVDPLMDYCPYIVGFTNGDCTNTANSGIGRGFEYFGSGSACFDSNVVTALDTQQKTSDARCLQYNCKTDGILQVKVGNNWFDCPADQSSRRITSGFEITYNGYVTCPSNGYHILCQSGQTNSNTPGATPTPTRCDNFLGLFCSSAVQTSVAWLLVISLIALWL